MGPYDKSVADMDMNEFEQALQSLGLKTSNQSAMKDPSAFPPPLPRYAMPTQYDSLMEGMGQKGSLEALNPNAGSSGSWDDVVASTPGQKPQPQGLPTGPRPGMAGIQSQALMGSPAPLGGKPSTNIEGPDTPITANPNKAAPFDWGAGLTDEDMAAAKDVASKKALYANLGNAADSAISTMTGTKPSTDYYQNLLTKSRQPVADIKEGRTGIKDKLGVEESMRKIASEKSAADPTSAESKAFQNTIIASYKQLQLPVDEGAIRSMSKTDLDKTATKPMELMAQAKLKREELASQEKRTAMEAGNKAANAGKATSDQSKAAMFATRMAQAEKNFGELADKHYDRASYGDATSRKVFPEGLYNENQRNQDQAERNFLNAVLRRESGAAISDSERSEGAMQYFPRAGDSASVKGQKSENRRLATEAMKAESGPAYGQVVQGFTGANGWNHDKESRYQELLKKSQGGK